MRKNKKTEKTVSLATLREILRDAEIEAHAAFNESMSLAKLHASLSCPVEKAAAWKAFEQVADLWRAAERKAAAAEEVYLKAKGAAA